MSNTFISKLAALTVLIFLTFGIAEAQKRKGPTLQTPYNFTYTVEKLDSCCFRFTVIAPDSGYEVHQFKVMQDDVVKFPFSYGFTYPNYDPDKAEVSWDYCPDLDLGESETVEITVWCNGNGHPNDGLAYTAEISLACHYETTEDCCVKYYLDCNPPAGTTVTYGRVDESGTFIPVAQNVDYANLDTDDATGRKYVEVCPSEEDRTTVNLKIIVTYPDGSQCTPCSIEETITTHCCNCGDNSSSYALNYTPFILSRAETDLLNCNGCTYKLEYENRVGLPSWADCYDSIKVDLIETANYTSVQTGTYDLSTFSLDDFGVFCVEEGETMVFDIRFSKNYSPGDAHRPSNCRQYFKFDCGGIVHDTTDSLIHDIPDSDPCIPDCPEVDWTYEIPVTETYTTTSGKTVRVTYHYCWRDACGYQDIQVTDIIYHTLFASWLTDADKSEIYAKIINDIVKVNKMNFDPEDENVGAGQTLCDSTWRVTLGSCWAEVPYTISPYPDFEFPIYLDLEYQPSQVSDTLLKAHLELFPLTDLSYLTYNKKCADVDCCTQLIAVCKTRGAGGVVTSWWDLDSPDSYVYCEYSWTTYEDPSLFPSLRFKKCEPICDWLTDLSQWINPAPKIITSENTSYIQRYGLKDYHADNVLTVELNAEESTDTEIFIYGSSGNLIETVKDSKAPGLSTIRINTEHYNSGAYYYIIIINGKQIKSDKFAIVK